MPKVKPLGKRVLVEKEKLDVGGLRLQPETEDDGQKNVGKIIAIGQVGDLAKSRGVEVGAVIYFRKFFKTNYDADNALVFVDVENILGIVTN